jgi:outer membrane protein TolC
MLVFRNFTIVAVSTLITVGFNLSANAEQLSYDRLSYSLPLDLLSTNKNVDSVSMFLNRVASEKKSSAIINSQSSWEIAQPVEPPNNNEKPPQPPTSNPNNNQPPTFPPTGNQQPNQPPTFPPTGNQQPNTPPTSEPNGNQPPVQPPQINFDPNNTDSLNPSDNPLLFPTQPEEVKINIDRGLTLKEAIDLALKNNKEVQAARVNVERSRYQLKEALAAELPVIDSEVQLTYNNGNSREDTTRLQSLVEMRYNVLTGGRRSAQIEIANKQIYFNQLELERIAEEIRFEAIRNYYDLQNADSQVEIEQAAIDDANQTLKDAKLLEQAGLGTKFDVLRAQVELDNAKQRLIRALAAQRTARRLLVQTLSLGQQVSITAADEIKPAGDWKLSLEESIILAYKNRAELEQFIVRQDVDKEQQKIELAAIKPQLLVFANYTILDSLENDSTDIQGTYSFGARMQWRLFDGGSANARAKQNEVQNNIDELRFANQRNQVRFEVERAYYSVLSNQENIQTADNAVKVATESLRLARLRFQAGVGTQTDVIQAQSELTTARGNYLRAITDYNKSLNELQRAVSNYPDGKLFEDI